MGEIFTNSMLKDWKQCKQKYYYKYAKKIVIPKKEENFELGKKVHALVSYKLNNFDTTLLENNANEDVKEHYFSILRHPLLKQIPYKAEWGFSVAIGNSEDLFVGRVDAIFYDELTNKYTIADWKTGMNIPKIAQFDSQAQIYSYAFYKCRKDLKLNIKPEDISFKFIQTPSLKESSLDFSEQLLEAFEIDFLQTIAQIRSYKHNKVAQEHSGCKFCEYRFLCFKN